MQSQARTSNLECTPSKPEFSRLACMSPIGGIESVAITNVAICVTINLCFSQLLLPILGTLGAYVLIVGLSLALERLASPMILWGLGWHVYRRLSQLGGKATADEVTRIYGAGQTITTDQLKKLIKRNAQNKCQDLKR
jgi:hypothetical protein